MKIAESFRVARANDFLVEWEHDKRALRYPAPADVGSVAVRLLVHTFVIYEDQRFYGPTALATFPDAVETFGQAVEVLEKALQQWLVDFPYKVTEQSGHCVDAMNALENKP
jgi:hypothetical protein